MGFKFEGCTFLISSETKVDTANTGTHHQGLDSVIYIAFVTYSRLNIKPISKCKSQLIVEIDRHCLVFNSDFIDGKMDIVHAFPHLAKILTDLPLVL